MERRPQNKEAKRWAVWFLPLLALIMSVTCVYSSTYLALSLWPTEISHAQMLAQSGTNYGRDQSPTHFAPISTQIFIQATKDSLGLLITATPRIIDASAPEVSVFPVQIANTVETPTSMSPPPIIFTASHTPWPTSEPDTPTPFPTVKPSLTPVRLTPTAVSTTLPATQAPTKTATAVSPTASFTATSQPTPPPTVTPASIPTIQPTLTPPPLPPTLTPPPLPPTLTPTPFPPTLTPTLLPTAFPTATASNTPTATATATPTQTATPTETPTSGPPPCSGNIPGGEPNLGVPNNVIAKIGCGQSLIVDLGLADAIIVTGSVEPAFDLIYFEYENPANNINLDRVIVEVATTSSGPWVQVFYWGNDVLDANTNIGQAGYGSGSEPDNYPISFSDLYNGNSSGIAIDIDAIAPAGVYQWLRITTPLGGDNDAAEVDSLKPLP